MKYGKIGLFELTLILLVFIGELPKAYVFSNSAGYTFGANFLQLPLYMALLYRILNSGYKRKQLIGFMTIGLLLVLGYIKSGQAAYFRAFLLIVAAKNISFKKIVRTCRYTITSAFVFTVLLYVCRISDSGVGRRDKLSFGYVHPNIVAQVVMIIMLLYLAEKGAKIKKGDFMILEVVGLAIMLFTGSKTAGIVIAIAPIVILIIKYYITGKTSRIGILLIESSQILIIAFTWWSAKMLPYIGFLKKLDLLFTNRIFLNYYQFNKYPLRLFGENVSLHEPGGAYNNIQNFWAAITCDCTYTMSLIIMGIIPTAVFALAYICLMKKAIKAKDYTVIAITILLAMYAFCESQLVEIYNNFVFFYIYAKNKDQMEKLR